MYKSSIIILMLANIILFNLTFTPGNSLSQTVDNKLKTNQVEYNVKEVALTFDDGPDGTCTPTLLDGLKKRNVKATFFIIGRNIEENEDLIIRMHNEGHLLCNHTYSHVNLEKISFKEACDEINYTNSYIYNLTGYEVKYIRPPFGAWNDRLKNETNLSIVMWNIDPLDWKDKNSSIITNRIVKNVKSGDIILLHDIFKSSVDAALSVVDELKKQGYTFVTIDKLKDNPKIVSN